MASLTALPTREMCEQASVLSSASSKISGRSPNPRPKTKARTTQSHEEGTGQTAAMGLEPGPFNELNAPTSWTTLQVSSQASRLSVRSGACETLPLCRRRHYHGEPLLICAGIAATIVDSEIAPANYYVFRTARSPARIQPPTLPSILL